jgi:CubicO group peptidase (beta-lactamase class C family)
MLAFAAAMLFAFVASLPVLRPFVPLDSEIRQILVNRIDVRHRSVGVVVGVIDGQGRRAVAYGHLNQGDARPLDGNTVFEIGSVTKVFTSLRRAALARAVCLAALRRAVLHREAR